MSSTRLITLGNAPRRGKPVDGTRATPAETRSLLRRLFGVAGLALLGVAATFGALDTARARTGRWAHHSLAVTRLARQAQVLAIDWETAVRGYLLTRDARSLEAETAARAELPRTLDSLIALTAYNPVQHRRALMIRDAVEHWRHDFAAPAVAQRDRGAATGATAPQAPAGKALFDDVRSAFTQFIDAEELLYAKRVGREDVLRLVAVRAVALEILALIAVLLVLHIQLADQTAAVSEQQAQLQEQAVELEERVEEALSAEERYRSLVDSLAVGVVLLHATDGIVAANPSAERILGLTADQMRGRSAADERWRLVRQDGSPQLADENPALVSLRNGEPRSNDVSGVHRPDGTLVWVEMNSQPLFRPGERRPYAAVVSFVDLTARKQLEQQLLLSQRMDAVGRLAGGVAHDFNNLLTVITGYSEILLETLDAGDTSRNDVQEIKRAAERAGGLTRQLLAFSRKQVMQPRALDLNAEVITGLEKMLRRLIGEDVELVTSLGESLDLVNADPSQLEQVIINLAVNAREAMPDGGRLLIETANVRLGADDAGRQIGVAPGRYVMLAVSDTGIGMSPEIMARMFEPFFTTKDKSRGTGLGLAMVYGIVKQSGGDILVDSAPGDGTTFRIYLPRVEYETAVSLPTASPSDHAGTETILLVEDDETLCALSRRILEGRGYNVLEALNGTEALVLCDRHDGRIDLVVSDVVMPGMNGRMVVERLSAKRPDLRVLFMSGYTDDDMLRRGIVDPRMAFLPKPFTPQELAAKVREVLDGPGSIVAPSLPAPGSPAPFAK